MSPVNIEDKNCWFVGSIIDDKDQTNRFITEGIWENGYENKYIDLVKSIKPGDPIAIKSSYTRKNDLPFDNRNNVVSEMAIKAVGIVTKNYNDGRMIGVDWKKCVPFKKWYFYTIRTTIWRVTSNEWHSEGLINFTFNDTEQDIDRFRNAPFWRERFGDIDAEGKFQWTKFYIAFADKLLQYKDDRSELMKYIRKLNDEIEYLSYLREKDSDGNKVFLKDICPFTVFGMFNRGITDTNRKLIASKMADFLEINEPVPNSFEGIPTLNNMSSWFFNDSSDNRADDISRLWSVFERAIDFADNEESTNHEFIDFYDAATKNPSIGWNLTIGLYWIRPWNFVTLDSNTRKYISHKLKLNIEKNGPGNHSNANDYLSLLESLETRFQEDTFSVHSFPELSYSAWRYNPEDNEDGWKGLVIKYIKELCERLNTDIFKHTQFLEEYSDVLKERYPNNNTIESTIYRQYQILRDDDKLEFIGNGSYRLLGSDYVSDSHLPIESYSISNIIDAGCFIKQTKISEMLERLRTKKNIILQGPPGTGKTWLSKKLAYALIGEKNENRIKAVQFHPNLSYEDFVRGWRPMGDGTLELVDGPLMKSVNYALNNPKEKYVIVIEEINRGNPAQIFGEMLTLLEADKRTPSEALELSYKKDDNETVYIPGNLYVIGTMNLADRSLALVDFALRRRFAFIDLEPCFNDIWRSWLSKNCNIETDIVNTIQNKLTDINDKIEADLNLGKQFKIGHSFVTPPKTVSITDARNWFIRVINTEIAPLLEEYWYDKPNEVKKAHKELLIGL